MVRWIWRGLFLLLVGCYLQGKLIYFFFFFWFFRFGQYNYIHREKMSKITNLKLFILPLILINVAYSSHLSIMLNPHSIPLAILLLTSQLYSLGFGQTFVPLNANPSSYKSSIGSITHGSLNLEHSSIITQKYDDFLGVYRPDELYSKGSPQYEYRAFLYNKNINTINVHNNNQEKRYVMGLNPFADIEPKQFIVRYAKLVIPKNYQELKKIVIPFPAKPPPPPPPPPPSTPPPKQFPTSIIYLSNYHFPIIVPISQKRRLLEYSNQINNYFNNKQISFNSTFYTKAEKTTSVSSVQNQKQVTYQNNTVSPLFIPINILSQSHNNTNSFASYSESTSIQSVTTITTKTSNSQKNKNNTFKNDNGQRVYTAPPNITIDWSCLASSVVNQGICGACYAIAALQSIYITMQIQNIKSVKPFSVQQIIACATTPKNGKGGGCAGGYFYYTFDYAIKIGTGRDSMYPYSGQDQSSRNIQCNTQIVQSNIYNVSRLRIRDRGFINGGDCYSLVKQLTTHALAVTISTSGFQFYIKGTYDNTDESPNHGVTLVGYDPINGYKIKNSWGTTWGMIGYAYVTQSTGVCDYSMYPITGYQRLPLQKPC